MKLEVVILPVADVDRSKEFYAKLGWRLDADFQSDNGFRVVHLDLRVPSNLEPSSLAQSLDRSTIFIWLFQISQPRVTRFSPAT
jgi:catechol 2,3-dioxygenase-like lactoylglutathione lyase family enzyme